MTLTTENFYSYWIINNSIGNENEEQEKEEKN